MKIAKHKLLLIILSVIYINVYAQRDTIPVNIEWQFSIDKKAEGLAGKWFEGNLTNARAVQLPHTWNVEEADQNHYGWGWYQKKIDIPAGWKNKNVVLQFGAINHTSYVYINGKKVKEQIGDGFNKFFINLNGKFNYGKENIITVACNNDYGKNKVPFGSSFDWPNDGGIIRPVGLIVSDKPSAAYLHATPILNVAAGSGTLKLKLGFDEAVNKNIQLAINISEENQATKNIVLRSTISKSMAF